MEESAEGERTFIICGKELILPPTPEKIGFPWDDDEKDEPASSPDMKEKTSGTVKVVSPKRKRFRVRKVSGN